MIKDELSTELSVASGVPQESVLEPILVLTYINNPSNSVTFSTSLFTDDTFLYQAANNQKKQAFQANINALQNWAHLWYISFNIDKCSILIFNQRPSSSKADYLLNGAQSCTRNKVPRSNNTA